MEVHKHPHNVTHKKNWGEYLLEFFMLFLAVFLGFIAENVRENIVERHREKEYMISMVEDLKKDSAFLETSLNKLIPYHLKWLDSTAHLLQLTDLKDKDRLVYQAFMVATAWTYNFNPTERTLSQLHSEGYHLIRKKNAIDAIGQLESQYKIFNFQNQPFSESLQNDIDLAAWTFADREVADQINVTMFQNVSQSQLVELKISDIPASAKIDAGSKDSIASYVQKIKRYSFHLQYIIKGGQVVLLREINSALKVLQKEYHLSSR